MDELVNDVRGLSIFELYTKETGVITESKNNVLCPSLERNKR
jgi:hypothetical protein